MTGIGMSNWLHHTIKCLQYNLVKTGGQCIHARVRVGVDAWGQDHACVWMHRADALSLTTYVSIAMSDHYLKVFEAVVHDALQQLICGGIAGSAHQDTRLASQIRQCAAEP